MDSIRVKSPLWGGYKLFSWSRREPFVGISMNKLLNAGELVQIDLEYLGKTVTRGKSDLVELAQRHDWIGSNGRLPCYYYPESYLVTGNVAE